MIIYHALKRLVKKLKISTSYCQWKQFSFRFKYLHVRQDFIKLGNFIETFWISQIRFWPENMHTVYWIFWKSCRSSDEHCKVVLLFSWVSLRWNLAEPFCWHLQNLAGAMATSLWQQKSLLFDRTHKTKGCNNSTDVILAGKLFVLLPLPSALDGPFTCVNDCDCLQFLFYLWPLISQSRTFFFQ